MSIGYSKSGTVTVISIQVFWDNMTKPEKFLIEIHNEIVVHRLNFEMVIESDHFAIK